MGQAKKINNEHSKYKIFIIRIASAANSKNTIMNNSALLASIAAIGHARPAPNAPVQVTAGAFRMAVPSATTALPALQGHFVIPRGQDVFGITARFAATVPVAPVTIAAAKTPVSPREQTTAEMGSHVPATRNARVINAIVWKRTLSIATLTFAKRERNAAAAKNVSPPMKSIAAVENRVAPDMSAGAVADASLARNSPPNVQPSRNASASLRLKRPGKRKSANRRP